MPGNMFIPPPQQRSNPIMGLLGQLALMKVQHDWSMEEKQMALEAKKVEAQEAKAEVRSKERSDAMMKGAEFTTPSGPVADPSQAYQQPQGTYYDQRYGQNVKPPPLVQTAIVDGKTVGYVDREGRITQLKNASDKLPSAEMQAFAEWQKVNPGGTYEKFAPWYANLKEKAATPSFGMSIDPATGQVHVTSGEGAQGMQGGMPLTPASKNKAQAEVFDIDLSIQNLKNVSTLYKPEYQQMATKWQNAIAAGKEKWMGTQLDPAEKQQLINYTNYRKAAVGMYSEEIAKGGGKTLTPFEVKIYGGKLPNAGTGMFDGDSPTEFESGMKQMYSTLLKSKARLMWYQAQGLGAEYAKNIKKNLPADKAGLISLDDMDKVINNRAAQLERDLKMANPSVPPQQLTEMVKQTIQKEFFGNTQ